MAQCTVIIKRRKPRSKHTKVWDACLSLHFADVMMAHLGDASGLAKELITSMLWPLKMLDIYMLCVFISTVGNIITLA